MKRFLVMLLALAAVAIAAPAAMATVEASPHDFHGVLDGAATRGLCEVCHVPHAVSATTKSRLWRLDIAMVADTGSAADPKWATSVVGQLCGTCHGNPSLITCVNALGQVPHIVDGSVYATNSHRRSYDRLTGGAATDVKDTCANAASRPYLGAGKLMQCTSCHNVHDNATVKPFLRAAASGAITDVCADCHNRDNGKTGTASTVAAANTKLWNGANHSMHPTMMAFADIAGNNPAGGATKFHTLPNYMDRGNGMSTNAWVLGGKKELTGEVGCNTCHAVHGDTSGAPTAGIWPYLLSISNNPQAGVTDRASLCEGCHEGGLGGVADSMYVASNYSDVDALGQPLDDHPIDQPCDGGPGLDAWQYTRGYESNAANATYGVTTGRWPYGVSAEVYAPAGMAAGMRVVCTSCHSAHGARAGESLRREVFGAAAATAGQVEDPTTGAPIPDGGVGNWCYSCHPSDQMVPAYHHSTKGIGNANTNGLDGNAPGLTSGVGCDSCHQVNGASLTAHGGFFSLKALGNASLAGSELCITCHTGGMATKNNDPLAGAVGTNVDALNGHLVGAGNGTRSHYIGTFIYTDSTKYIQPKTSRWRQVDYKGTLTDIYSKYGGGTNTRHIAAPSLVEGTSTVTCESCHSVLFNTGYEVYPTGAANKLTGGWKTNLLLELYEDTGAGLTNGTVGQGVTSTSGTYADYGAVFCIECHRSSFAPAGLISTEITQNSAVTGKAIVPQNMHPMTGWSITRAQDAGRAEINLINSGVTTYADQVGEPNGASYPASGATAATAKMDCDSCHRPHRANNDGYFKPKTNTVDTGTQTIGGAGGVAVILEKNFGASLGNDFGPFCRNCHNM